MSSPFASCPKCGHYPMPKNQAFPCECPKCGLILAKYRANPLPRPPQTKPANDESVDFWGWLGECLFHVPDTVNPIVFWGRFFSYLLLLIWGWRLIGMNVATGEIVDSFAHRTVILFHEAGHLIFRPFGEFVTYLGGTLGQLLMPIGLMVALIRQNSDSFGASLAFWWLGVSLLDVAPYMYDALHPQLMLISGLTGADGGDHDWMYLFGRLGQLQNAQRIGEATKAIGMLVVLSANLWGAYLLYRQYPQIDERDLS